VYEGLKNLLPESCLNVWQTFTAGKKDTVWKGLTLEGAVTRVLMMVPTQHSKNMREIIVPRLEGWTIDLALSKLKEHQLILHSVRCMRKETRFSLLARKIDAKRLLEPTESFFDIFERALVRVSDPEVASYGVLKDHVLVARPPPKGLVHRFKSMEPAEDLLPAWVLPLKQWIDSPESRDEMRWIVAKPDKFESVFNTLSMFWHSTLITSATKMGVHTMMALQSSELLVYAYTEDKTPLYQLFHVLDSIRTRTWTAHHCHYGPLRLEVPPAILVLSRAPLSSTPQLSFKIRQASLE
jgi:hypothetical protein